MLHGGKFFDRQVLAADLDDEFLFALDIESLGREAALRTVDAVAHVGVGRDDGDLHLLIGRHGGEAFHVCGVGFHGTWGNTRVGAQVALFVENGVLCENFQVLVRRLPLPAPAPISDQIRKFETAVWRHQIARKRGKACGIGFGQRKNAAETRRQHQHEKEESSGHGVTWSRGEAPAFLVMVRGPRFHPVARSLLNKSSNPRAMAKLKKPTLSW